MVRQGLTLPGIGRARRRKMKRRMITAVNTMMMADDPVAILIEGGKEIYFSTNKMNQCQG